MSFVIAVHVTEGIVMASDSRQSVTVAGKNLEGGDFKIETVNSDAVTKTFLLDEQRVGISGFGQDLLGGVPTASHLKRFVEERVSKDDDVEAIPRKLVNYLRKSFPNADAGFHVAGYKKEGKISVPHVYSCNVARDTVERRNVKADGSLTYGATWSGQGDILSSIIAPVVVKDEEGNDKVVRAPAPIIWDAMSLQDAIDFAIYAIRTTIDTMRFQARPKNVGGAIDVLLLTPEESRWIQRKELLGSSSR